MNNLPTNSSEERALITLPARALIPAQRWLPAPIARRAALITAVGAAGAVGTFFLKRLGELAAEELFRRIRPTAPGDSRLSSPRQGTDPALNNPSAADESIRLRLVSVQRVISGPYGHQRLRIRQGWLLPPTPPEETGD